MKFGAGQIYDLAQRIAAGELPYADSIIIGDNSSGKSLLLKKFIETAGDRNGLYFMDAVNRGFDVRKVAETGKKPDYKTAILETRMDEAHFNLADSFSCFGTQTECAEMIYRLYEKDVQELFFRLTGERFTLLENKTLGEVDFGSGRGLLSSGFQAIIRILLELLYYQDMAIKKFGLDLCWIVIDELDEFLSPRYAARIFEFLKKEFSGASWLVSTHSCDLVANVTDANLVLLDEGNCEVLDINDYRSVSEVQVVFGRLFGQTAAAESEKEAVLRRLLNNKINGIWSQYEEEAFQELLKENLSAAQQLILRQIQEW